ncbi:MAG: amidohydrolase [Candidatus Eisenbacteria bacterium]|nr:amidohydrolase [Candidatus Latescibacterota bacterium]MBD3301476.1 amidohydrolase [Candidatus Eisenbacteria bacterium]
MTGSESELTALRRELHRLAERSGSEEKTAERIAEFLRTHRPDRLETGIGGHGVAALFEGAEPGPRLMIRADLDALPIDETIRIAHASRTPGVAHKCGHDGHMTIVAGLASLLREDPVAKGSILLLFQPSEETGEGADRVLADPKFSALRPDFVLALHNLPGYPERTVVVRDDVFAYGSIGVICELTGATSHAAEPAAGRSPALAIAQAIEAISALPQFDAPIEESAKATVIHARVGERAFGTSPGEGQVLATLRSGSEAVLQRMRERTERILAAIAGAYELQHRLTWVEEFPPTRNDADWTRRIRAAASALGYERSDPAHPFPWSEDFGHFTAKLPGALFGFGVGTDRPALHHPDYDFPDAMILPARDLLAEIIRGFSGGGEGA